MPVYEFHCSECDHKFTIAETFKEHEEHKEKCPKCGSRNIKQLISEVYAKTSKKS